MIFSINSGLSRTTLFTLVTKINGTSVDCYIFILDREGEFDFSRRDNRGFDLADISGERIFIESCSSGHREKKKWSKRQCVCGVSVTSRTIAREECTEIGSIREKERSFPERADQYRSHMSLHSPADKLQFAVSPWDSMLKGFRAFRIH